MWLLSKNIHQFQFLLLYLFLLLLLSVPNEVYSQYVMIPDQVAKEGDNEVVIPCNYSQFTNTPVFVAWNEVNEAKVTIANGIVNTFKPVNGRYSFNITTGKTELVIAKPLRNDTNRRFQCQITTKGGDNIISDPPSILTVYYLYEPVLTVSANSVYEGESVNLNCSKPDGNPVPTITWYKDGQALSTTDTTRFITTKDTLEILYIEATTLADAGSYTCEAESDQFRGEDGKTSNQIDLKVKYLIITFEVKAGNATCTANGNPKPSSVMIYKNGELIANGKLTASVKINEEICRSDITCYAENGNINATELLKTCNTDGSKSKLCALCVIPVIGLIWILCLIYFIFCRNIEMKGDDLVAVEGDKSLAMKIKYRPSIAHYSTIQWDKKNEEKDKVEWKTLVIASAPKLGLKYILHCCFYFCGICCYEYIEKYQNDEKKGKTREGYEKIQMKVFSERGSADGQDKCVDVGDAPGKVVPGEEEAYVNMGKEKVIEESQLTSTTDEESESLKDEKKCKTSEGYIEKNEEIYGIAIADEDKHYEEVNSPGDQDSSCETNWFTYAERNLSSSVPSCVIRTDEATFYAEINHGRKLAGDIAPFIKMHDNVYALVLFLQYTVCLMFNQN